MFGFLNVHKPSGCTSRDVVNQIQRLVRPDKIGHCGTLDPLADGVLVVAIGPATRLVEYVQQMPKHYRGRFLLGHTSDTEDIEGDVRPLSNAPVPTHADFVSVIPQFCGNIQQRPPAYSALKVKGRRAYDLARKGESVVLEPRAITVYGIELLDYGYPHLELEIVCGSGTYVRSLGRDLAEAVGTGAVMDSLTREAIGPFRLSCAVGPEQITAEGVAPFLLPAALALHPRPELELTATELGELSYGRPIDDRWRLAGDEFAAVTAESQLAALLVRRADRLWPTKNFAARSV